MNTPSSHLLLFSLFFLFNLSCYRCVSSSVLKMLQFPLRHWRLLLYMLNRHLFPDTFCRLERLLNRSQQRSRYYSDHQDKCTTLRAAVVGGYSRPSNQLASSVVFRSFFIVLRNNDDLRLFLRSEKLNSEMFSFSIVFL